MTETNLPVVAPHRFPSIPTASTASSVCNIYPSSTLSDKDLHTGSLEIPHYGRDIPVQLLLSKQLARRSGPLVPMRHAYFLALFQRQTDHTGRPIHVEASQGGAVCWEEPEEVGVGGLLSSGVGTGEDGNRIVVRAEGIVKAVANDQMVVLGLFTS